MREEPPPQRTPLQPKHHPRSLGLARRTQCRLPAVVCSRRLQIPSVFGKREATGHKDGISTQQIHMAALFALTRTINPQLATSRNREGLI